MENLPLLRPMLATSSMPYDSEKHLFEVKWDGYRCLSYLERNSTVLYSRNGIDITAKFPELAKLHERVSCAAAILDGEIVVFVKGKPSFAALQSRGKMKDTKAAGRIALERPAVFMVFDVLYAGGKNVMDQPLEKRKVLLEQIVAASEEIVISQYVKETGLDFYSACVAQGLEGVIAKKLGSAYLPGRRSAYWQKFRHTREADLVICGYQWCSAGGRLGSLLLGGYRGGNLVYQGKVGTGFSEREVEALLEGLHGLEVAKEPFKIPRKEKRRTVFVQPLLVCSVNFHTTTNEGYLRHPVYRGIRRDKRAEECDAVG